MNETVRIFLVDNGSLRPEATFWLRCMAEAVTEKAGLLVEAVSLLHSHKVAAEDLEGEPARIVEPTLAAAIEEGARRFVFLPLFLGPSRALTEYLPQLIEEAAAAAGGSISAVIADPLAGAEIERPDPRLAQILAAHVRQTIAAEGFTVPDVALVDHGTPVSEVNTVRNRVAEQLAVELGSDAGNVVASSMERREGPEYDFNDPLLETLGGREAHSNDLVAAMFFLLPGRHAGEAGDVAEICDGLKERSAYSRIAMTPLLAESPGLVEILNDRLTDALRKA